ncbi:MAG: glycosyltransferase [Leptolyngbyaceae cyanobacterium RM2_2_4]|nr:glycosyltransferase [Leptolyngbyaceae cyanobacterium SM1_4_3]NJN90309.1 glycosyltransferase [Leptolyngbyaceae cyanobacterium SL_5_14]NJO52279.1 glycosyltransferase [Leptolyngbyaceae cyanobacterium RM2_2_4]
MPLISVVTPAYNAEKTIKRTVKSVLDQTFSDLELIVINDGSKDSTLDILSNIKDPRLKVFSHSNSGPQISRNRGIKEATGEYISFLDADDLWTPDKLESQFNALQANPEAAVAYSWTDCIDESDRFLRRGSHISATGDVFAKLLSVDFIESGSNPLIRRHAVDSVGYFDESLVGGQDWDMWLRLAAKFPFTVVPLPQILYRKYPNSNSWSNNVERQEIGFKRVIEKALAEAPDSVKCHQKTIISNRYKCLIVDALERPSGRKRALTTARFLWIALKNDPSLLRARVLIKVILKTVLVGLLPDRQAQALFAKLGSLSDVKALQGYLRLDPSQVKKA